MPSSRLTNLTAAFALAATDDVLAAVAGLMERRAGASDQRFIALHLTRRGQGVAERALAARRGALRQPLTALTTQEQGTLEKLLDKMLYAMTPDRERCDHICRLCEIAACPQDICPVESAAIAWQASAARRDAAPAKRTRRHELLR